MADGLQDIPSDSAPRPTALRRRAAEFWLELFINQAHRRPWLPRAVKPLFWISTWVFARHLRRRVIANARHILGPQAGWRAHRRLGWNVIGSFYDFVVDVGASLRQTAETMRARVLDVEGQAAYEALRRQRRGAVLVTAHLGSFEAGLAAIAAREKRVHVVFQRDPGPFERLRSELRGKLGVAEAPVDDGLATWARLRAALQADEVVLIQGDRVMPGQRGVAMPFFDGHMELPTGPVKLALAAGAPLAPVYAPVMPDGRVRIVLDAPIEIPQGIRIDAEHPSMLALARSIEAIVTRFPEQWHTLHQAWVEDAAPPR